MLIFFRNLAYGVAIIAGLASVYITLGTLNGRLSGGLTLANRPWAISLAVFAAAVVVGVPLQIAMLARRRRARPWRSDVSGRGWVQDPPDAED
jgi:hypothetical protein